LSKSQAYDNPIATISTAAGSTFVEDLELSTIYFWRVGVEVGSNVYWSDSFSFRTSTITGVAPEEAAKAHATPNPFSNDSEITFVSDGPAELVLLNSVGQFLHSKIIDQPTRTQKFQISEMIRQPLAAGVYILRIRSGKTEQYIRLVKK
jgi:hypothetical protein